MSCLRLTHVHGKVVQYSVSAESAIFHAYNAGGNHFDRRLLDQVLGPLWIYLKTMNG